MIAVALTIKLSFVIVVDLTVFLVKHLNNGEFVSLKIIYFEKWWFATETTSKQKKKGYQFADGWYQKYSVWGNFFFHTDTMCKY